VSKEDVACYRLYAANCLEMAKRLSDAERKLFLLKMAQGWGNLADRLERAELDGQEVGVGGEDNSSSGLVLPKPHGVG
jgi:hypothetical protein